MTFDSLVFIQFFLAVYVLHRWAFRGQRAKENLLLLASYLFYSVWDWRFLSLILISSMVDWFAGQGISKSKDKSIRRFWLGFSLCTNLGLLFSFKYMDFSVDNLNALRLWWDPSAQPLELPGWVLPVGISFYTFQSLSYTIDIYKGVLQPASTLRHFLLFVAFFPQLVAGPIVKAKEFLPQLNRPRSFEAEAFSTGVFLIFFGAFKKVVLADVLALGWVDETFSNPEGVGSLGMLLAVYGYAGQIYCDFSGYSDMAIGCAMVLGFSLPRNFDRPYLARNPSEFWKGWHISLSTWIREYLYIPLGGNRVAASRQMFNLVLVMFLGGLWHGAAWNFVIWGVFHGLLLVVYHGSSSFFDRWPSWLSRLVFFQCICTGWIFFRCDSLASVGKVFTELFSFTSGEMVSGHWLLVLLTALGVQCLGHERRLQWGRAFSRLSVGAQALLIFLVGCLFTHVADAHQAHQAFIYFQF